MWILKLKGKVSATSDLNVYGTVLRNSEHKRDLKYAYGNKLSDLHVGDPVVVLLSNESFTFWVVAYGSFECIVQRNIQTFR